MLEVRAEIMGYTLDPDLQRRRIEFKLRTPWKRGVSHDFKNKSVTLVVTQEEFDNHKVQHLEDRPDVLLFLEVWAIEDNLNVSFCEGDSTIRNCCPASMAGLVRYNLNDQLKDHNLSPSIQWLNIHDPIRNSDRGKILIRVWTTFGDFRIRHVADDAKPTNMKSKSNPSERVGPAPVDQKAPRICSSQQSQPQPQPIIRKSILPIPSQPDGATTTFENSTRKIDSASASTCLRTTDAGIDTCNTVATITNNVSSRSGTASSGSSRRSRKIAADIYHD